MMRLVIVGVARTGRLLLEMYSWLMEQWVVVAVIWLLKVVAVVSEISS